jgi:hypothetical protein
MANMGLKVVSGHSLPEPRSCDWQSAFHEWMGAAEARPPYRLDTVGNYRGANPKALNSPGARLLFPQSKMIPQLHVTHA